MSNVAEKRSVQTYSREAERLSERVAQTQRDPALLNELALAVRTQAAEIAEFLNAEPSHPKSKAKG